MGVGGVLWITLNIASLASFAFSDGCFQWVLCCGRQESGELLPACREGRARFCYRLIRFCLLQKRAMPLAVSYFSGTLCKNKNVTCVSKLGALSAVPLLFLMGRFAPFSSLCPFYQ